MRIKKVSQPTPIIPGTAQIINAYGNSTKDGYSCNYVNNALVDTYSTSEVKTNKVWVDGKPIYRKVITGTTTTKDTAFNVAHGVSNYGIMMIDNKSFVKSVSGSNIFILPINCPPNTSSEYNKRPVRAYVSTNNISIYIGGYNGYTSFDYAIILEYTKTTD